MWPQSEYSFSLCNSYMPFPQPLFLILFHSLDVMRLTLAEFGPHELAPAAIAKCICLFMRLTGSRRAEVSYGQATVDAHSSGPRRASHQADMVDLDSQTLLRAGSSGALWREAADGDSNATGHQSVTTRPSSLFVPKSICDRLPPYSLSASEPRLNRLDSGVAHSSCRFLLMKIVFTVVSF